MSIGHMANVETELQGPSLLEDPGNGSRPSQTIIARLAAEYGVHPLTQMREVVFRRIGRQKLSAHEYYDLRVFDPSYDRKAKSEFLGQGAINAINEKINPDRFMDAKNFIGNKLVYTAHLNAQGIASTETQAIAARNYTAKTNLLIDDEAGLVRFLRERARYPLFGKPLGGSKAVGSVRIDRLDGNILHLSNGSTVGIESLAREVFERYADGYLLQTALTPHRRMADATGEALCCIRMVTVREGRSITPLYSIWKISGPDAMSDNFWQKGSMLALVDNADGKVTTFIRGKGLEAENLTTHPESGVQILGTTIPYWDELCEAARATHAATPDLPILGLDIAVTDDGPVMVEGNDLPNHIVYQYAARRGVYNSEFRPIFERLARTGGRS